MVYDACNGTQVSETDQINVEVIDGTTTSLTTIVSCDPLAWNNVMYNSTGIYTHTTTNSAGCDSIATLDLTVNLDTYTINSAVSCEPYFWSGQFYDQTGVYQVINPSSTGCDSLSLIHI